MRWKYFTLSFNGFPTYDRVRRFQMHKFNNIHPKSKLELRFLCFQQKWKIGIYEEKDLNNVSNKKPK